MLIPITSNISQWSTPDPEDDVMMVGHILTGSDDIVLIDPPVVPGLARHLQLLGHVSAIVLTTHDHTRGSRFLSDWFKCPIYVPEQADHTRLRYGRVEHPVPYREGVLFNGIVALRARAVVDGALYLDEMVLSVGQAVFIGDLAAGRLDGSVAVCPEQFHPDPAPKKIHAVSRALLEAIPDETALILPGHGYPIAGRVHEKFQAGLA